MTFLRIKTISGKKYYYLVKSVRVNGKVRQKVVRYLGRSLSGILKEKNGE